MQQYRTCAYVTTCTGMYVTIYCMDVSRLNTCTQGEQIIKLYVSTYKIQMHMYMYMCNYMNMCIWMSFYYIHVHIQCTDKLPVLMHQE